MRLDKFYLDVVNDDGAGGIGYAGQLRAFGVTLNLASTLHWPADPAAATAQHASFRGALPATGSERIRWNCPALHARGEWIPRQPALAELELWRAGPATLRWQVFAPSATADLEIAGQLLHGLGYVERLRLDAPPWKLPIDTLRWGRFVSAEHTVIWIDWAHRMPRRWIWHNGSRVAAEFTADGLCWLNHRLTIERGRVLRDGRLGETTLNRWPLLHRLLPVRLQRWHETKWCAPARLESGSRTLARGGVIHETVHFR